MFRVYVARRGSKAPASLHLVDLQLKPSLPDLRAPEGSLPFDFIPGAARNRSVTGKGVLTKALFVRPFCSIILLHCLVSCDPMLISSIHRPL